METRLALGAGRIGQVRESAATASALRADQARVFADFATYLTDVATRPLAEQRAPFCRIILPPRTGKTVVAGHIIDRAELAATFIVPTRTLLEQTVRELARQIPGVKIGSYGGGHDHVVAHGVNVTTYAMLHAHAAALPVELRRAALVFVDEAHHAMTTARSTLLATAFDRLAVRVALTATPDDDSSATSPTSFTKSPWRRPSRSACSRRCARGSCWLRVPITPEGFDRLITGLYPDAAGDRIFAQHGERYVDGSCSADRERLLHALHRPSKTGGPEEPFATGWRAISGGCPSRADGPETLWIARTEIVRGLDLLPRLQRHRRMVVVRYFGLFGRRSHTFAQLGERAQVSSARIGQILARALRDLRRWYAQAETDERLLAGPDDRMLAEATDRRAAALAAAQAQRARHLDAVFADADHVWEDASKRMISRSSYDYDAAQILLDDLLAAADRHAARAAFGLRLAELRAGTATFRRFWQRWDALHPPGAEPAPPT